MPVAARLGLAGLIIVVALAVALWPRDSNDSAHEQRVRPTSQATGQLRDEAGLAPCPRPAADTVDAGARAAITAGALAAITATCLADGQPLDLAVALAGRPALLNLWAYWCGPCAQELPYLQQYAQRAGNAITVLTVHSDPDEAKALSRLTGLGVTLPGVLDPSAAVRTAVGAPSVLPISVLLRADGSVAEVVVRSFTGVDDITDTVAARLGVRA
ncbi:TlpA disulfide reductase family protein [Nocardia sp. NPDC005366]|uniref:TlpA family protein disulfide reductase n=1 Tax=Nocardia sp. NPDC005366 TaxID=3156878 RepID=UPI0033B29789